jgi:hypothetical protein
MGRKGIKERRERKGEADSEGGERRGRGEKREDSQRL